MIKNIVIGRRENLSDEDNNRRATLKIDHGINIVTYDRLIDTESRIAEIEKGRIITPYWND